jgi:hypothetical protein
MTKAEKESSIKENEFTIKYYEKRGASAEGYLDFYKELNPHHYTKEQVVAIYEADKVGVESAKKRYLELTGKEYGDRRRKQR